MGFLDGLVTVVDQGEFGKDNVREFNPMRTEGKGPGCPVGDSRFLPGDDQVPYIGLGFTLGFGNNGLGVVRRDCTHLYKLLLALQFGGGPTEVGVGLLRVF